MASSNFPTPVREPALSQGHHSDAHGEHGVPTPKERRYDRQLRLWGSNGQDLLENAHALLINHGSGAVGTETLKNLVLPGLGKFTIVDPATVTEEDLGINFFLDRTCLGAPRAQKASELLGQLNPDSQGSYISDEIETLLSPDFLVEYTIVIVVSPIRSSTLCSLSDMVAALSIPLIYVHSVGFLSRFCVGLPRMFPVIETHPDPTSTVDLRLLEPWSELSSMAVAATKSIEDLSDYDHGHVPYLLLLLHYMDKWRGSHDGKPPQTYREKVEYRTIVSQGARTKNAEGGEENFDEATAAVLKSLNPPSLSSAVRDILQAEECLCLQKDSSPFWVLVSALKTFYDVHSALPLNGSLPDMKARSSDYIQLQESYRAKARADQAEVLATVRAIEEKLDRRLPTELRLIESFCKHAASLKLLRGKPLLLAMKGVILRVGQDSTGLPLRADTVCKHLTTPSTLYPMNIAFLAYDLFHDVHRRSPGSNSEGLEADLESMESLVEEIYHTLWTTSGSTFDANHPQDSEISRSKAEVKTYCHEITRAGGGELHNISALTGGLVAQEVIKIITKQYIPMDNLCLYDGIAGKMEVFRS